MVHLGHHVRRQSQDSNVAPNAGFRTFSATFAFFEVQHQRQDKETRVQMLSHIFGPRRRSAAHVVHHRSAYRPPSHPNLAAHADPAFRARTHLGKRSDKSCLLLVLPLALPDTGSRPRRGTLPDPEFIKSRCNPEFHEFKDRASRLQELVGKVAIIQ